MLTITEFLTLIFAANQLVMAPAANMINAEQSVAIGGTSTPSNPFSAGTNFIMVHADADCALAFAAGTPTANANLHHVSAGETRFYGVLPGWSLAVIEQ